MLRAEGIVKTYPGRGGPLRRKAVTALDGVDLEVPDGGAVSLIGESGCGKTTLGRILAGLETPDRGRIWDGDAELTALLPQERRRRFQKIQMIPQDPYSALNPARTLGDQLRDPLRLAGRRQGRSHSWVEGRARELLELVGLDRSALAKYPHQLSGGQRQRFVIARALTVEPEVLVADEAVSMIDVSLRLGILALLRRLRQELGVAVLFITHDVAAARYVGDDSQMYVIYRGAVVEWGPTDSVIQAPVHPYTQALLSALPVLHGLERPAPERFSPTRAMDTAPPATGCPFAPRCPFRVDRCDAQRPPLVPLRGADGARRHACLLPQVRRVVAVPIDRAADAGSS
jgi:oligopeptide/dipeptide ABC transporter ATP-binding protein